MHFANILAVIGLLQAVSARPQGECKLRKRQASTLPQISTESKTLITSFADLWANGTSYGKSKIPDANESNLNIYTIFSQTVDAGSNTPQQPLKSMQISWLNPQYTIETYVDNFSGDERGVWTGPRTNPLDQTSTANANTTKIASKEELQARLQPVFAALEGKGLKGPWNELSLTLPKYDPRDRNALNTNGVWYTVRSYNNTSVSYLVSSGGTRVVTRTSG